MSPDKINIQEKLDRFDDHWNPRIVSELNGQQVKLAKLKGEFVWHSHAEEDELFYVLEGQLEMQFHDRSVWLSPGEMITIPKGVEHRPVAPEEVHVMLFEPASTINTGDAGGDFTRDRLTKI